MSIEVTAATDGLAAVIEEAAVLFANAQDKAALKTLVTAVRDDEDTGKQARQIWLMLFDLYAHLGMKKEHDELALDFAAKFERSPPTWTEQPGTAPTAAPVQTEPGSISFSGALDASIAPALEQACQAAVAGHALRIELGGLAVVDAAGSRLLLECLQQRRRAGTALSLSGDAHLISLLTAQAVSGERAVDQAFWLLLLEIHQMTGMHEAYEDAALNFAITYELSPPAWEPERAGAAGVAQLPVAPVAVTPAQSEQVLRLEGEIVGANDQTLKAIVDFAAESNLVVIDFSAVPRVDFVSAGQLLNTFSKLHQSGKAVKIRGANELIVALFAVMGVQAVTGIEQKR